ncbi:Hypothetical protein NTJ_03429 [Nesidiocoris tenuis]|uniref:Uncharacterized protein n=1 Tax=Nesidiocoris tenuis TaxID=355587 RepID=A0ABN7AEB3_9HEMI|nr:Hypothetical protein NTJ_03429 [Nesidiocoris tenuis]
METTRNRNGNERNGNEWSGNIWNRSVRVSRAAEREREKRWGGVPLSGSAIRDFSKNPNLLRLARAARLATIAQRTTANQPMSHAVPETLGGYRAVGLSRSRATAVQD